MSTHKRPDLCAAWLLLFLITLHGVVASFFFFSYGTLGKKERKAQGLAFGFNFFYGYLSQQHFIANPPLPALFKKDLASFHNLDMCLCTFLIICDLMLLTMN